MKVSKIFSLLLFSLVYTAPVSAFMNEETFTNEETEILRDELDSETSSLDSAFRMTDLGHAEINLETLALGIAEEEAPSAGCLADYVRRKRQLVRRSIINPLLAIPATAVSAYAGVQLGASIGKAVTGSVSWGSIAGSGWGFFVGFWSGPVFFTAREAVMITKLIGNLRMQKLLVETAESRDPALARPILEKLQAKILQHGRSIPLDQLSTAVRTMNSTRALCDGSLTGHADNKSLRKKLLNLNQLAKRIAADDQSFID